MSEHEAALDRQDTAATLKNESVTEAEKQASRYRLGLIDIRARAISLGMLGIADMAERVLREPQRHV